MNSYLKHRKFIVIFSLVTLFITVIFIGYHSRQSAFAMTSTEQANVNTNKLNAWDIQPFKINGLDNIEHSLQDWRGKVIILNFWASWCAPCQQEIKHFVLYQQQYGSQGLQIVSIGLDQKRRLANVKRSLGINYPVLVAGFSASGKLLPQWGNKKQVLPYSVVIAQDGRLVFKHRGVFDDAMFTKIVKPLLAEKVER